MVKVFLRSTVTTYLCFCCSCFEIQDHSLLGSDITYISEEAAASVLMVELADSGSFEAGLHGVTLHKTVLFFAFLSVHTTTPAESCAVW
jgi:hypothetical protein